MQEKNTTRFTRLMRELDPIVATLIMVVVLVVTVFFGGRWITALFLYGALTAVGEVQDYTEGEWRSWYTLFMVWRGFAMMFGLMLAFGVPALYMI